MTKKVRRVLPYTSSWENKACRLALSFCPPIHPCVQCGNPVISGYMCQFCDCSDPSGTTEEQKEFTTWVFEQRKLKEEK